LDDDASIRDATVNAKGTCIEPANFKDQLTVADGRGTEEEVDDDQRKTLIIEDHRAEKSCQRSNKRELIG